jgi:hypothetical protein
MRIKIVILVLIISSPIFMNSKLVILFRTILSIPVMVCFKFLFDDYDTSFHKLK